MNDRRTLGVLWDLDGTLVQSGTVLEAAVARVLRDEGLDIPPDLGVRIKGRDGRGIYEACARRAGAAGDYRNWSARLFQYYRDDASRLVVRRSAAVLFRELDRQGVRQAVVSNGDRLYLNVSLEAIGLSSLQMTTVSRNDVRAGKPSPESYLRAAWLLDADPARFLVVEDSVVGARAGLDAGMDTLFWPQSLATATPAGAIRVDDGGDLRSQILSRLIGAAGPSESV